jgi:hypothetical protein
VNDHQAICEVRYRYALGLDTRDWELYRSIFVDEVEIDFSSFSGESGGTMRAGPMRADDWVATCRVFFTGLDASQHVMTNPMVTVDGDRAHCRMYMTADHYFANDQGGDRFVIGGYYDDRLVRTDGAWLLEAVKLTMFWQRGNRQIMELAAARGVALLSDAT